MGAIVDCEVRALARGFQDSGNVARDMKLSRRESLTCLVAGVLAPLIGWRVFGLEQPHETFIREAKAEIERRGFIVGPVRYNPEVWRGWLVTVYDPECPTKGCSHVSIGEYDIQSPERKISLPDLAKLRTDGAIGMLVRFRHADSWEEFQAELERAA